MSASHIIRRCACVAALSVVLVFAKRASAVTNLFFDIDGTNPGFGALNGGTFDWDSTANGGSWNTDSTGGAGGAISGWQQAQFPEFFGGAAGQAYTVTVSNEEQIQGMFNRLAGVALTINAVPSSAGALKFVNSGTPTQGIINSAGSDLIINAPITGGADGTIINPNNGGNVRLYGPNTYTGGTSLTVTNTLVYFNSSSSFGSGTITCNTNNATGFAPILGVGGATITLPNAFKINYPTTGAATGLAGINFAADPFTPVVSAGNWNLGTNAANTFKLRNNGVGSSPLTLSGVISGAASIELSTNSIGTIYFGGANTYTGKTTITGPGGSTTAGSTQVDLVLNTANTIASSSSVVMAGGFLDPNGLVHTMGTTTLGLTTSTAVSTIDFSFSPSGAELDFANSSTQNWTGSLLNLKSWDPAIDKLRIGTNATGLTPAQLAKIEFNGSGLGTAVIDPTGYVHAFLGGDAGDYNRSTSIEAADFATWRKDPTTFGNDPNGYVAWRENFGSTTSTPSPGAAGLGEAAVPEPSTLALVMLVFAAIAARHRQK